MKDMEQNITKELPYGIQDFVTIAEQNIYYVDKTMYIPELEKQAIAISSVFALAVLARACSSVCSMLTTIAVPKISSKSGLVIASLSYR